MTALVICMGTTPPVVGRAEELLGDEVGLDLLLGSLLFIVSSLSCPLSPPQIIFVLPDSRHKVTINLEV